MSAWRRLLLFTVWAAAIGSYFLVQANRDAHDKVVPGQKLHWLSATVWLKSSACAAETGAWLAVCVDGRLEPISNYAIADDPGHAFILAMKAKLTQREQNALDIVQVNLAINFGSLLLLCLLLLGVGNGLQAFLLLLLATPVYLSGHTPGPHSAVMGAATLAALLPLCLLLRFEDLISGWRFGLAVVCGVLGLACAVLLREPVGTMGLLMTAAALACLIWRKRSARIGWLAACVVVASLLAWKSAALLLAYRDYLFPMPASAYVTTHGTAHNLYLGLGVVHNKWGIQWRDAYGQEVAQQVKPDIVYASHEYFAILRRLYLQRLWEDPREVWRIYSLKAGWMLQRWFPRYFLPLGSLTLLLALDAVFLVVRIRPLHDAERLQLVVFALSLGFVTLFVLQGALAHPSRQYSETISAFVVLAVATWLSRQFALSRSKAAL